PVLLGDHEAEQAQMLHLVDDLGRVPAALFPLPRDRNALGVDEVSQHRPELLLVAAQCEVHRVLSCSPNAPARASASISPASMSRSCSSTSRVCSPSDGARRWSLRGAPARAAEATWRTVPNRGCSVLISSPR